MTDISVIKMIISVAVWRIYPSWMNDKLRAWEGLGHSGMFWARLSRDNFRSKLEIISFLSRVMSVSKSFLFPALLKDLAPNVQALGLLVSTMFWGSFENSAPSPAFFLRTLTATTSISWKFPFFFPKHRQFYFPDGHGDPKSKQSTLVMVRRKLEWKLDSGSWRDRAQKDHRSSSRLVRVVCDDPWSRREKKTQGSQRVIVRRLNPSSSTNQRLLRSLFPRPDVATISHFAVFVDVDVQLQDGQAAARGQRRKAVIRDISGVDHGGVTNLQLSAPIWFTGQRHCTVFRHVMQLSLLVLCWKSTLTVILPQIKKKRSLSNVGHRGTKAENLAWHSTG